MPLTDTAIRGAKPTDKAQKLFDGNGLFLFIPPKGAKSWRLKYRFQGREKRLPQRVAQRTQGQESTPRFYHSPLKAWKKRPVIVG